MAGAAPDVQGLDRKEIDRPDNSKGRWPANIILDPYTAELLDQQSGDSSSKAANKGLRYSGNHGGLAGQNKEYKEGTDGIRGFSDSGGASRFFYVAKASKRDRNEGLEELEAKYGARDNGFSDKISDTNAPRQNFHPTVKPTSLMEYLIKLVTPPNGTVLDPFTGSGSTGKAAILQGFDFIGIEMTEEYLPIIEGRLKHAEAIVAERIKETSLLEQEKLF
jgi:site-specific DNA-methyltransferase (adenine-specific)